MKKTKMNPGFHDLRCPGARRIRRWARKGILACFLCALFFCLTACSSWEQPGETVAEGHRRHLRKIRLDRQQRIKDVDTVLLLDQPSKLTEKRIP